MTVSVVSGVSKMYKVNSRLILGLAVGKEIDDVVSFFTFNSYASFLNQPKRWWNSRRVSVACA